MLDGYENIYKIFDAIPILSTISVDEGMKGWRDNKTFLATSLIENSIKYPNHVTRSTYVRNVT